MKKRNLKRIKHKEYLKAKTNKTGYSKPFYQIQGITPEVDSRITGKSGLTKEKEVERQTRTFKEKGIWKAHRQEYFKLNNEYFKLKTVNKIIAKRLANKVLGLPEFSNLY